MAPKELAEVHSNLPAEYIDFGMQYAGVGMENTSASELLKPFLTQLHYQCAQIEEGGGKFIEGARPGMLFNTATQQVSDGLKIGVETIICYRQHVFTEWEPDRGGFRGQHSAIDEIVFEAKKRAIRDKLKFGELYTDDGNTLTDTFNLYLLYAADGTTITDENAEEAVLAFSGTRQRAYQEYYTKQTRLRYPTQQGPKQPALFAHTWRLKTKPDSNDKGKWFTYDIQFSDPTLVNGRPVNSLLFPRDSNLFHRAAAFHDLMRDADAANEVTANYEQAAAAEAGDSEIPF